MGKVSFSLGVFCAGLVPFYAQAEQPLRVTIVDVRPTAASQSLLLTGTLEAQEVVPLAFKSAGRLVSLFYDLGDSVEAGEIVAALEPTQAAEVERASAAQLAATEAAATQAEQAFARARDLLARGAGRQAELESAEQAWLEAVARRDEARAGWVKAQQALEDMTLRAPLSGTIVARSAERGQIAAAGQPVVSIAANGAREAVFAIPSLPQSVALEGLEVEVALLEEREQGVRGQVSEVSPLTDANTGTVALRVALPAEAQAFDLGAAVVARFDLAQFERLSVPARALTRQGDGPAVWVIDPATQRVDLRPIKVARYTSETVEISEGLTAGERVVVAGSHLLYPQRKVVFEESQP